MGAVPVIYDEDSLARLSGRLRLLRSVQAELLRELNGLRTKLRNEEAVEYLFHGVGRRLSIITRCIRRIFELYPPDRGTHLDTDTLDDVAINLHAFLVNVAGIFDNLGWVYALEHDLVGDPKVGKLRRTDVGLLKTKTQERMPEALRDYLGSKSLRDWHSRYSKTYRDALAHRIPLYVPSAVLNVPAQEEYRAIEAQLRSMPMASEEDLDAYEKLVDRQGRLGEPSPFFVHSQRDGDRPVLLHAQVICDHMTVEEAIRRFCGGFDACIP